MLAINAELVEKILINFLKNEIGKFGFKKAVLGLSGGIDSAVVAVLLAKALGPSNVLAVKMPYRSSSQDSVSDADSLISQLGIHSRQIEITAQLEPYFKNNPEMNPLRRGNLMARTRMIVLYDASMAENALVVGTSNKTELLLGYGTQFGDMASALNPIGDLYKTQIFDLARHLQVPATILNKAPSADLWQGQTDEAEMGFTYEAVDQLLYHLVDQRFGEADLVRAGFALSFVQTVMGKIRRSQYKRRMPILARLSERTLEGDFLYPRDWGV